MRALAGILLAAAAMAGTADAKEPPFKVKVTPSPFYADLTKMHVEFTPKEAAGPGRRYFLLWQTLSPPGTVPDGCSPISNVDMRGLNPKAGQKIAVDLTVERLFGDYFCPGPSEIGFSIQLANPRTGKKADKAKASTAKNLGRVLLRVRRPI